MNVTNGGANPAARNLGNYRGTGEFVPLVNRTLEWGVMIATCLSVLSIVPRHCACLTDFLHPKLRKIHGGATTTGPDATHPPAICQNSGGGGGGAGGRSGGGQLGGVGGGFWPWGGFVPPLLVAPCPQPTISQNPGGGGLGGVAYKDRARPPPRGEITAVLITRQLSTRTLRGLRRAVSTLPGGVWGGGGWEGCGGAILCGVEAGGCVRQGDCTASVERVQRVQAAAA